MRGKWLAGAFALVLLQPVVAFAITPRLTFVRRVAPAHDLAPAERLAMIYAIGDSNKVESFVEQFVGLVTKSGVLQIENAVERNAHLRKGEAASRDLRREHPADAYLGVTRFTCAGDEKSAEGSTPNEAGDRVRRTLHWLDATCSGRVDVLDSDGKRVLSFSVRGEGTSPRSTALTDDDRDVAYEQAAHQAAFMAAEAITPRLVRESIELDDSAPAFDDGYAMVRSDRLEDARSIWLAALARHAASASLHYNLAAVCEAIGDVATARTYLEKAVRLSAGDRRFVTELNRFQQRNATTAPK